MNPCLKNPKISRGGAGNKTASPLVFPLQIQNALYKALHALGAVLSHAFDDMSVPAQRESSGSVSKIALYAFHIIPGPEGVYRKCMAKIVEAENEVIPVEAENRTWNNLLKALQQNEREATAPILLRRKEKCEEILVNVEEVRIKDQAHS